MIYYASVPVILSRLRRARLSLHLAQAELARRSGIPQSQISKLEAGRAKDPALSTVLALSAAMNIPATVLLNIDEEEFKETVRALQAQGGTRREIRQEVMPFTGFGEEDGFGVVYARDNTITVIIRVNSMEDDIQQHSQVFSNLVNTLKWPARLLNRPADNGHDLLICLSAPESQKRALCEQASTWLQELEQINVAANALSKEEIVVLYQQVLSLQASHSRTIELGQTLPGDAETSQLIEMLTPADTLSQETVFDVGDQHTRTLVLHQLPANPDGGWTVPLYSIPNITVSWDITPLDVNSTYRHQKARLGSLMMKLTNADEAEQEDLQQQIEDLRGQIDEVERRITLPFSLTGQALVHDQERERVDTLTGALYLSADQVSFKDAQHRHHLGFLATLPIAPTAAPSPAQQRTANTQIIETLCPWTVAQAVEQLDEIDPETLLTVE